MLKHIVCRDKATCIVDTCVIGHTYTCKLNLMYSYIMIMHQDRKLKLGMLTAFAFCALVSLTSCTQQTTVPKIECIAGFH